MNIRELRQHLTVVAAGFCYDHIRGQMASGSFFGGVLFNSSDIRNMVEPGWWA